MSLTLPSVENEMSFTGSVYPSRQSKGVLVPTELSKSDMLPELHSNASIDKMKHLPKSLQTDFIPEDILFALNQPLHIRDKLGPPTRKTNLNTTSAISRPPPANVWHFKRRNRFKHLLDHPSCVCGAGKDISFLYDVPNFEPHPPKPDYLDQSSVRKKDETSFIKPLIVPESIIPEEYHIVKNKGVLGIEYHEDKYSTHPIDHEKHLSLFPSMNPTSRYEVIQLKNTFESMMDKAGVNDLEIDALDGPTQMHNLLALIKKEQNIYNIVFNELIRQATVECAERGELLHLVWNKYHELLNKVPEQIMSLHEEVIAQRALDLRLTDELMRFKGTIGTLTSELTEVKEHDIKVTKEAHKAQEELRSALIESHKNASLLAEYHDLYELQRQRLEKHVFMLSEEREIWSTAAYSLAVKVTEEYKLNTAKRLQLLEKSWLKLAGHFTILLSDRDTDLLTKIQRHIEKWRDFIDDVNILLKQREENMRTSVQTIAVGVENYLKVVKQKYVDLDNRVTKIPDEDFTRLLITSVKSWLESVIKETDAFSGVTLLNIREVLSQISGEMEEWMDSALKMFGRHCSEDSKVHPDQISMLALNEEVDQLLKQLHDRSTGENGVAEQMIHFQSSLETWTTRFLSSALGVSVFKESDWESFFHVLEEWLPQLNQITDHISIALSDADQQDDQSPSSSNIHDVIRKAQKWVTRASNSIDSEDSRLVEQVSSLHSEMVRWMIKVLLRLAPDKEGNSQEAAQMALLGSASIQQLTEIAITLFESLENFSNYVALCCDGIVLENTLRRQDNNEENAEYELNDLKRLKMECTAWIQTAQMLLSQLTGMPVEQLFSTKTSVAHSDKTSISHQESLTVVERESLQISRTIADEIVESEVFICKEPKVEITSDVVCENEHMTTGANLAKEEDPNPLPLSNDTSDTPSSSKSKIEEGKRIEVLGIDANTHKHTIEGKHIQSMGQLPATSSASPDTKKAFEALAAVQTLQDQLIVTEERAQVAEERAFQAEAKIVDLEERIRALEKQLETQHQQVEPHSTLTSATLHSKSPPAVTVARRSSKTNSPLMGADMREEKSGKKSGKSSSKSGKRN